MDGSIWLVFTLLAVTSRSFYSLGVRMISTDIKVSPVTQTVLLTIGSGLLSVAVSPIVGGINISGINNNLGAILIIIISAALGNIIYFKGQKLLDAGSAQVAFSSILVWGAILSVVFLGSDFSVKQLFGMVLLLFAFLTVQYQRSGTRFSPSFLVIVFSAVFFSLVQVASASVSRSLGTGAYLMISYFGPGIVISIFNFRIIKNDISIINQKLKPVFSRLLFASGTSLLYFLFSFLAYQSAPDRGVVVVLLTSQVIFSVMLGIIFLNEKENLRQKIIAGILAVIAGILIKS